MTHLAHSNTELTQAGRVRAVIADLRALAALVRATGESSGRDFIEVGTGAAFTLWSRAFMCALECVRLGGVLSEDEEIVERPDYCFPVGWRDPLLCLLTLWRPQTRQEQRQVPAGLPEKVDAIAAALERASVWFGPTLGVVNPLDALAAAESSADGPRSEPRHDAETKATRKDALARVMAIVAKNKANERADPSTLEQWAGLLGVRKSTLSKWAASDLKLRTAFIGCHVKLVGVSPPARGDDVGPRSSDD